MTYSYVIKGMEYSLLTECNPPQLTRLPNSNEISEA